MPLPPNCVSSVFRISRYEQQSGTPTRYPSCGTGVKLQTTTKWSPGVWPFAQEGDDGIIGVVEIDPIEAGVLEIDLVQRSFRSAQLVELRHQALQLAVGFVLKQIPVQALGRRSTQSTGPVPRP